MRYKIKKNIESLLSTIYEGLSYVESASRDAAAAMIQNCVTCLDSIKRAMRPDEYAVHAMELTQDLLRTIQQIQAFLLDEGRAGTLTQSAALAKRQLLMLKSAVTEEIPAKLEIAFLPFRAALWDGLQSIYQAAAADAECECFVVPLPYYERSTLGGLARVCYEGSLFPPDIPLTHYSDYDVEARHPDIVYIQHPYDGGNRVTSMDPYYFSDTLARQTELLVYVPHFIAGAYADIRWAAESLLVPAARSAHRMVAQSDSHRDLLCQLGLDKDKVSALGNPLWDLGVKAAAQPETPAQWRETLEGKTVFLWCSSFSFIAGHPGGGAKYLYDLLHFLEGTPDCALIWRPYPLTVPAVNSRIPQLADAYSIIERKMAGLPNVICDHSPSPFSALCASSALLTNSQYFLHIFMATGKPALFLGALPQITDETVVLLDPGIHYCVDSRFTVGDFCRQAVNNEDPMGGARRAAAAASILHADGGCGAAVHEQMKRELIASGT